MSVTFGLGNRGYTFVKDKIKPSVITDIKKELTVKPFINQDIRPLYSISHIL